MSVRQVAVELAMSSATVYALCARGELKHVRISNAIRVRREDLDAFVAENARSSST